MSAEAAEDYLSSLGDLTINSKPLINMLTMLAEENIEHASAIVQAVEQHLQKVRPSIKLPVLYLIDSIVKNVGGPYINLFTQNIVSTFCGVFEKVDERVRENMFKLRQTWNDVFPAKKLYALDVRVSSLDPAWPVMATPVPTPIHINRKFLNNMTTTTATTTTSVVTTTTAAAITSVKGKLATVVPAVKLSPIPSVSTHPGANGSSESEMRAILLKKQKEFLELQQKKLELELLQTKAKLEEQQKALEKQTHGQLLPKAVDAGSGPRDSGKPAKTKAAGAKLSVASTGKKQAPGVSTKPSKSPALTAAVQALSTLKVKTEAEKHGATPVARSRDPRLAGRQAPSQGDGKTAKPNTVVDSIKKVESATLKPQIKENLSSTGLLNKESKGISRKDPRLRSNKVLQSIVATSSSKDVYSMQCDSSSAETVTDPNSQSPASLYPLEKPAAPRKIVSGKVDKTIKVDSSKSLDGKEENSCKATVSEVAKSSPPSKADKKKVADKKKDDKSMLGVNKATKIDGHQSRSPVRGKSPLLKSYQRSRSPVLRKSPDGDSPHRSKSPSRSKSPTRSKSPIWSKSPTRSKSPTKSKSPLKSKSPTRAKSPQKAKSFFTHKSKSPVRKASSPIRAKTSANRNKSNFSKIEVARASPTFRSESPVLKSKTSSRSKSPPQIPRTAVEAVMNVFLGGKSSHRSSPIPRTASPIPRTDSPLPRTASPVPRTASPLPRTASPLPRTASPVPRTASPVTRTVSPTPRTVSPTPRTVSPMPRTVSPTPRTVSPTPRTVSPTPRTVSPTPRTVSPTPRTVSPTPRTVSPVPRTVSPTPRTVSPVPRTVSPIPRTGSPISRTTSPVENIKSELSERLVQIQILKHAAMKVRSQSLKKSPQRKKSPEPSSPLQAASEHTVQVTSILEERKQLQSLTSHKHRLFGSSDSDSSESPPSKFKVEDRKGGSSIFKEKRSPKKSRHYRERASSRSPDVCISSSTGDVDLRQCGPPQKLARLATFQADVILAPTPVVKEDAKSPSIEAAAKDVDLRQLPGTPSKKRPSLDGSDQPQVKKSKAEMLDALFGFGGEDVDLRQLPATAVTLPVSPPPVHAMPHSPPGREKVEVEQSDRDERSKENEPEDKNVVHTEGWAKYKELKPDTFKSPRPFGMFNRDIKDKQKLQNSALPLESPVVGGLGQPAYDKLGRPLLYNDPKRRTSLSSPLSPLPETDTDMRQQSILSRDALDSLDRGLNFDLIVAQADEQLKSGTLSSTEYNKLLQQMIQLNETHKLRVAQRRDEQEKLTWEEKRRRKKKRVDNSSKQLADDTSPVSSPESFPEEQEEMAENTGFSPLPSSKFGDIDERFQSVAKLRLPPPTTGVMVRPPSVQPWSEITPSATIPVTSTPPHPPPRWEHPVSWRPPATSVPHPPPHPPRLAPPLHLMPPGSYHRPPGPPGPDFPGPGSYGLSRWRAPFPSRPYDTDSDHRFDRFGGRSGPGRFPRVSLHSQMMQHPPPSLSLHSHLLSREQEVPPADPIILDLIAQDSMRTIAIDSVPRNIRFYGDTAVVILTWDNPREISFQPGTRRITFDDRESFILSFNSGYREIILDGNKHRIRLGAPTRELYIDGKWYECFFGGPPLKVELDGKLWTVKLDGPSPQVRIGVTRLDLVAGKVNLIIDARTIVPIFLDAKPQRFDIEGMPHILRFADALRTVLINGQPLDVEFGGLPKPIIVGGKKHFLRLSMLPEGIVPGYAKIVSMEGSCLPSPPHVMDEDSNSMGFGEESSNETPPKFSQGHEPALPIYRNLGDSRGRHGLRRRLDKQEGRSSPGRFLADRDRDGSMAGSAMHAHTHAPHRTRPAGQLPLELLTSLMPGTLTAPASACSYQVEQESQDTHKPKEGADAPADKAEVSTTAAANKTSSVPFLPVDINVEELFKKLVATGIVSTASASQPESQASESKKDEVSLIKEIDLKQPETLKIRQPALITMLYSGIQCSSCGVRFSPEQTMKYSQHLDWHFRQNRRDRDNTRKAQSRKWYYDVSDWIQFEEIEDLEERAQSWFEVMQAAEGRPEDKEEQDIPSVSAGESLEDTFCDVCHDKFEQFYNEEREEWHLRLAIRVDGKTYHPICYDDFKASLEKTVDESVAEDVKEEESEAVPDETVSKEEEKEEKKEEEKEEKKEEEKVEEKLEKEEDKVSEEEKKGDEDDETADEDVVIVEVSHPEVTIDVGEDSSDETPVEAIEQCAKKEEVASKEESTAMETGEADKVEDSVIEGMVTIKLEPPDSDDDVAVEVKPEGVEEVKSVAPIADTTLVSVACSIDGNVQFEDQNQVSTAVPGKIKINITKPITTKDTPTEPEPETEQSKDETKEEASSTELIGEVKETPVRDEETEMNEPPPPGVGPEPVHMKPLLVGRKLTEFPKVQKGKELSALCSIM